MPFDDLAALESALRGKDVAAFIVEPIQGKGVYIGSPGYLLAAQRLCRKYGALFIDDEVQSGMGRTGKFLAIEHDGNAATGGGFISLTGESDGIVRKAPLLAMENGQLLPSLALDALREAWPCRR